MNSWQSLSSHPGVTQASRPLLLPPELSTLPAHFPRPRASAQGRFSRRGGVHHETTSAGRSALSRVRRSSPLPELLLECQSVFTDLVKT